MDVKNPIQLDKDGQVAGGSSSAPVIRTMKKDIAMLEKYGHLKKEEPKRIEPEIRKATPPSQLPVMNQPQPSSEKPVIAPPVAPKPAQSLDMANREGGLKQPGQDNIKKEMEIKQRIEETRRRLKEERERAQLAQRHVEEKERERERLAQRQVGERKIQIPKPEKNELEKPIKKIDQKSVEVKQEIDARFVFGGLALLLIIIGVGGFFYWKYYIKEPALPIVHLECQDYQCVEIEGEGENKCSISDDCLPPETISPDSLILVDSTETIEVKKGEESLVSNELKILLSQNQEKETFKRILIKSIDGLKEEYLNLNQLVSALNLGIPISIFQSITAGDINGDNYTLFSYSQEEGNRIGLVLNLIQGSALSNLDLKNNWETTIVKDLEPLLLKTESISPATLEFQDGLYQEKNIRYINFPSPNLSIDYTITNDKILITTSRDSMYELIESVLFDKNSTSTPE